jgi:septum site-determining protein MinD
MNKVIVITSGKGGVGKTTTAINLGAALSYFGEDVLIVDGNLSTPNIGVNLGSPEVPINLNHVLSDKASVREAVYGHESGINIIPASLSIKDLEKLKPEKLKSFKKDFKNFSDWVLVDCAAGLNEEARAAIEMSDELIVVTNPEMAAITDALKAIKFAEKNRKNIMGIIVTRVRKDKIEMSPEVVKEMLEVPILGMVPEDIAVKKAINEKSAVVHIYPKSKSARAYKEIAAKILDVEYDSEKDKPSIFEIIFRRK